MYEISDFQAGQRVELHPATDLWMRGARYGTVRKVGGRYVQVALDRPGWGWVSISPSDIGEIFLGDES